MLPEEIIIAPVVTEKSNDELQEGKYTFKVNKKATKVEIAKAVEKLFEVKVLKIPDLFDAFVRFFGASHQSRFADHRSVLVGRSWPVKKARGLYLLVQAPCL